MNKTQTVCVVLMIICFIVMCQLEERSTNRVKQLEREAIELGHAHYNSTNGVWQWKGDAK